MAVRLALSVALGACAPESPSEGSGSYFEIHNYSEDAELCAGTVDHLDRFVERVFAFLEEPPPPDFFVPIDLLNAEHPCSGGGCYKNGKIWVNNLNTSDHQRPAETLRHELVHAIHARAWGLSVPFFNEGLAQSLSTQTNGRPGIQPIRDMLDKPRRELDYDAAGRFVRFLIDTRGLLRFRELLQGARGRDGAGLRAWIGEVYGEPFEDIEDEYLSGDLRCYHQLHLCDPVDAERVDDHWFMSTPASCQDTQFHGASAEDGELFAMHRTLELVQGGRYLARKHFTYERSDPAALEAQVMLLPCGTCDQIGTQGFYLSEREIQLAAGTYTLEIVMPFDTVVSVSLQRLDD